MSYNIFKINYIKFFKEGLNKSLKILKDIHLFSHLQKNLATEIYKDI